MNISLQGKLLMPEGDEFLVELVAKDIVIKYKGIKYVRKNDQNSINKEN